METVFALGSNSSGQLGIGHREDVSVPKQVRFHSKTSASPVVLIATGGNHTLFLNEAGELYCSGDASTGACGIFHGAANESTVFWPARLVRDESNHGLKDVALIAATWEASFIVTRTATGKRAIVYSLGVGMKGELGLGKLIVRTTVANLLPNFPPEGSEVVDLATSMGYVIAVLDNGDVYGWGNGRKAQLGEPTGLAYEPRKISDIGFKVVRAVCTKEATCLFGTPDSGHIRLIGSDKWGIVSGAPQLAPPWRDVGASWGAIYILKKDSSLHCWGRNDHGQLPPPNLPGIKQLAAGSEHVVALSEDGDAISWGWGEHGNCGPHVENNDVKGRWNTIAASRFLSAEAFITKVGAGCATSWVCIGHV